MVRHNKKPGAMVAKVFRLLMVALVLVFGGLGVLSGLDTCAYYKAVQDSAVTVEAVVTKVERFSADDGWEYDVYIRYGYAGENYEVLYLDDTGDGQWKNRLGQTVSVEIDPADPGVVLSVLIASANSMLVYVMIMNMWIFFWPFRARPVWTQTYGCSHEYIQRDLEITLSSRWLWKWGMLSGAEMLVIGSIYADIVGGMMLPCGVLLAFLGLMGCKRFRRDMEKVRNGEFTIREDTLVEKCEESDGDGGLDCFLVYSGDRGTWRKKVSDNEYARSQVGQVKRVIYLDGEKKPTMELPDRVRTKAE